MKKEDIIKEINHRYLLRKMAKYPYMAPEQLPKEVQSDQVKVLMEVFAELIEEITEKKRNVIKIDTDNLDDVEFATKFLKVYSQIQKQTNKKED